MSASLLLQAIAADQRQRRCRCWRSTFRRDCAATVDAVLGAARCRRRRQSPSSVSSAGCLPEMPSTTAVPSNLPSSMCRRIFMPRIAGDASTPAIVGTLHASLPRRIAMPIRGCTAMCWWLAAILAWPARRCWRRQAAGARRRRTGLVRDPGRTCGRVRGAAHRKSWRMVCVPVNWSHCLARDGNVLGLGLGLGRAEPGPSASGALWIGGHARGVDADALNLLAGGEMSRSRTAQCGCLLRIPGEAARLLGVDDCRCSTRSFRRRGGALQPRYGGAIVLKGRGNFGATQ